MVVWKLCVEALCGTFANASEALATAPEPPYGNPEKIKLVTPFWKTQKMLEIDCPQAAEDFLKLPLPLPCRLVVLCLASSSLLCGAVVCA